MSERLDETLMRSLSLPQTMMHDDIFDCLQILLTVMVFFYELSLDVSR